MYLQITDNDYHQCSSWCSLGMKYVCDEGIRGEKCYGMVLKPETGSMLMWYKQKVDKQEGKVGFGFLGSLSEELVDMCVLLVLASPFREWIIFLHLEASVVMPFHLIFPQKYWEFKRDFPSVGSMRPQCWTFWHLDYISFSWIMLFCMSHFCKNKLIILFLCGYINFA